MVSCVVLLSRFPKYMWPSKYTVWLVCKKNLNSKLAFITFLKTVCSHSRMVCDDTSQYFHSSSLLSMAWRISVTYCKSYWLPSMIAWQLLSSDSLERMLTNLSLSCEKNTRLLHNYSFSRQRRNNGLFLVYCLVIFLLQGPRTWTHAWLDLLIKFPSSFLLLFCFFIGTPLKELIKTNKHGTAKYHLTRRLH